MALTEATRNALLDGVDALIQKVSLHNADPGAAGTVGELSGGSPAYARLVIDWEPAATGNKTTGTALVFDVPAGSTVAYFGLWTTAGAFRGSGALSATESYTGQGTYTIPVGDLDINLA